MQKITFQGHKYESVVISYKTDINYHDCKACSFILDRLSGLADRVPGYRTRGSGSIPGATRFSEE
jgi:hypothetical protein